MPHTDMPEEDLMRGYEDLMSPGLYEVTIENLLFADCNQILFLGPED